MPEAMSKLLIRNYSTLLELDYKPLLEHLNENFEQYVKDVVLKIETNTEETLDAVLEIIEKEEDITDILQLIKKKMSFWIVWIGVCLNKMKIKEYCLVYGMNG